ncbi:hypothetical protein PC110_g18063 [Phytophthora cactorum]|nr:hypothetical protein PC110_g18063 [Phytophthora cactorum]
MLFLELKARFGDEKVAQLLVVAARDDKVKIDVRPLVTVQLNYWHQGGKTAEDIFNLLKLSEVGDELFDSPMFRTWISYVTNLNDKNSDELMFSVIKKHYDDDILDKLFVEAKKEGNYENHCLKIGGGDVAEPRKNDRRRMTTGTMASFGLNDFYTGNDVSPFI